jgi:hypothetical protein
MFALEIDGKKQEYPKVLRNKSCIWKYNLYLAVKLTYGPKVLGKNSVADNSYKNGFIFLPNFQKISLNYSYYKTTFK